MRSYAFVLGLIAVALPLAGQGVFRPPEMPGEFRPVVGSGATYSMTSAAGSGSQFTYAVVGQEGNAYWLEIRSSMSKNSVVMKQLMSVPGAGQPPQIQRMIMQAQGRPPMELPVSMLQGGVGRAQAKKTAGSHGLGEKVGVEKVTVAAGTFECDHYRSTVDGRTSDVWVSAKVPPYGLVKMVAGEMKMELQRVLAHETSQISGEPVKLPGAR